MTTISSVQTSQVYIMYSEIPHLHDKMNIKIGISVDPEDRRKGLQTSNPFPIHIIKTFNAGIEALKHEKHFHDLYEKYNATNECRAQVSWCDGEKEIKPMVFQY